MSPLVTPWIHLLPSTSPCPTYPNPPPHKSQSATSHLSLLHPTTDPQRRERGWEREVAFTGGHAQSQACGLGGGVFSGPSTHSTLFPQSTLRSSMASLQIQFLTTWSNEDGLEVNGVMILLYRHLTGTFLSGKALLRKLQLKDDCFSLSFVNFLYSVHSVFSFRLLFFSLMNLDSFCHCHYFSVPTVSLLSPVLQTMKGKNVLTQNH